MKRKCGAGIAEDIISSKNAIRKKYRKLKLQNEENSQYLEKSFKPITEPLKTMIKSNSAVENIAKLLTKEENMDHETNTDQNMTKYFDTENSEGEENKTSQKEHGEPEVIPMDPLLEMYFALHRDTNKKDQLDKTFGVRSDGNRWLLGDSPIYVKHNDLLIKDKIYKGTEGLYELMFLKNPNPNLYNKKDLNTYKEMILSTNAHKQGYEKTRQVNSNKGDKYKYLIKDLVQPKTGSGVHLNSVRYEFWDDVNELVDELRKLVASREAGNTGVINAIHSIIEELKEAGVIE
jgi:hypothetical protein